MFIIKLHWFSKFCFCLFYSVLFTCEFWPSSWSGLFLKNAAGTMFLVDKPVNWLCADLALILAWLGLLATSLEDL